MLRKIIIIFFLLHVFIFNCKSISNGYEIIFDSNSKILKINNNLKINLTKNIEEILKQINAKHEKVLMPGIEAYSIEKYNILLQFDYDSKKLLGILCNYYGDNNEIKIKSIIINNIRININTSYEKVKKMLKKSNIKYEIDEATAVYYIKPEYPHISWIVYSKDKMSNPKEVMINIE